MAYGRVPASHRAVLPTRLAAPRPLLNDLCMSGWQVAPPAPADLHARFREELLAWREGHAQGHVYALLDPHYPVAPDDELNAAELAARPLPRPMATILRPDLAHEPDLLPLLVQLYTAGENGYVDEALLDLTFISALERCRSIYGSYVAGWLLSEAQPVALAKQLARSGVILDLHQGKERFFPLFEPHRLALLADSSPTSGPLQRWLAPVDRWLFIDSAGALRRLDRERERAEAKPLRTSALSSAQAAAQDRVATARYVVMAMDRADLFVERPEKRIDESLQRGQQRGLRGREDLVLFALNDLTLGLRWSEHPVAAAVIEKVAMNPELALGVELSALPDEVLDAFGSGSATPAGT